MSAPAGPSPADRSSGVATAPRLAWNAVRGAFRYDLYLDTQSPPAAIAAEDIAATTFAPANLEPLRIYFWRVVAKGDRVCDPFRAAESPVWSFTTSAACQAPGTMDR